MTDGPSPAPPPAPKPHGRLTHWFVGISAALSLVIAAGSAYGFVAYKLAEDGRRRHDSTTRTFPGIRRGRADGPMRR